MTLDLSIPTASAHDSGRLRWALSLPLHADRCHPVANLECLHAGLDDRGKDRFTLVGVCKHIRDLVQEAREERDRIMARPLYLTAS